MSSVEELVLGARYAVLDRLAEQSDVISINASLKPQSDGMFDRDLLFGMKKGVLKSIRKVCFYLNLNPARNYLEYSLDRVLEEQLTSKKDLMDLCIS